MHVSCLTLLSVTPTFGWVDHGSNVLPFFVRSFSYSLYGSISSAPVPAVLGTCPLIIELKDIVLQFS